ncbi:translocase of chloroplast 120, chloroplastic-like [Salvia hispanica]|uniref:translocase of chloroplast 120, chloroplastic-like n=1 Tax=Salvia hispanica TaxID=49212 RepID=UPI002009233D|nr:translocase of chloroplast 120, chloroplastic-like [Salvia hispanica]
MENGIGIAEDAKLEERNGENHDGLEHSVKEIVRSSLDGSNCSLDEGVIEEDVAAKTRISGAGDELNTDVENSELIGTLEGNPDKFTVMSGVNVNPEILTSEENHDDGETVIEEVVTGEKNGSIFSKNNGNGHDVEDGEYKEIVESAVVTGETEKLEKSNQELDDGQSDNKKSFLEALISGDTKYADADNTEKLIPEDPGTSESTEVIRAENSEVENSPATITEIPDDGKLGDGASFCNHENGTSGHEDLVDSLDHERVKSEPVDVPEDHIREISVDNKDQNGVIESEAGIRPESESIETDAQDNEQKAVPGNMHAQEYQVGDEAEEKLCISSANRKDVETIEPKMVDVESMQGDNIEAGIRPDSESIETDARDNEQKAVPGNMHAQEYQVGDEAEEKLCISSANPKDVETIEPKMVDVESTQGDNIETQHVGQKEINHTSVSGTSDSDHAKESAGIETNLHAVDDSNLVKEIAEVNPQSSSPELSAKGSSHSQPNLTNDSAEVSGKINERPEQVGKEDEKPEVSLLGNKDEQQEASLSGNKQQEVRPSIDILSSAGNSSTADFSPARPANFEDASKVQEPVTRDDTAIAAQEPKPAADKSFSAKSVANHSSGVGHNSPLSEPTPQNMKHGSATDTSSTNSNSATPTRPAGLGRAAPLLEPSSRVVQQPRANGAASATQNQLVEDPTNGETEEYDETREKLQMIRVKFLRLARRLGQTPHNVVVAQVLYRLGLAEQLHGRSGGRGATFSFDRASAMAEQLEAGGQEPLDFTCTIMVLGKSGVGKSATLNSIFDEVFFGTDAFELGTKKVQDIVGTVQGIRVRVIDTPGLLPSWSDQRENERILRSVKNFIKKTPPDIVLYLDRLDMQSRDFGDMPLLRTITETFGPSIWFNAIVVLTHAASAPPEGPNGTATSYDMFVTQRSHVVQQAVRQAAGDMRLMNPVSLVENHSACRTNRAGQRVLPNGQVWKPHLLLLSFASKILAEANTLLKLQDTPPGRPFAQRTRSPPLPFLLSSILQSRPEVKLPSEQFGDGDDDDIDDGLDECSDEEENSEYDELPPFKPLSKAQLDKLSKVQRKAYYDELEYREKLFMKQQLKEERKRRKMMKKLQEEAKNMPSDYGDNGEEETSAAASVPVPMPDLALPASFDSDNPTHRYRSLDSSNPWLVRAVLEPNGWDHDIGYDGINVERLFVVKEKVPISFSGHISKDKKDANLQMEFACSVKHGKGKATSLGFDMQSLGKDYAYTLRSETRFSNHRINKATAGISATVLGDVVTGGLKLEDKLIIGKRGQIVVSGGGIYGRGEVAYGGSLEATLRDKDHPLGRFLSTFGLSVMDWHGDVAIGCNSQTQIPIGRHSNLFCRFNINNKGSGQFSFKVNSTEQLQIVLVALVPLAKKILGYSQQSQYA